MTLTLYKVVQTSTSDSLVFSLILSTFIPLLDVKAAFDEMFQQLFLTDNNGNAQDLLATRDAVFRVELEAFANNPFDAGTPEAMRNFQVSVT